LDGAFIILLLPVTLIDGAGYIVSPPDDVNGVPAICLRVRVVGELPRVRRQKTQR
jgi:hypothetical protein